jgi:peptidyl-prolyl cis-trans isomerase C
MARALGTWATIVLAATAMFAQAPAPADAPTAASVGPNDVVLQIGDKSFTAAEFEKIMTALPPQFRATLPQLGKKGFAEQFANLYGLSLEGEKRKLDQTDEFQRMMEFDRHVLLAQLAMNAVAAESGPVGDEEVSYYYQTHSQDFEQFKVTGIYIPFSTRSSSPTDFPQTISAKPEYTEQEAQRKALEMRARVQSGQNMASLAKLVSQHPTAAKGGDFGYLGHDQKVLDAKIANAIFALQPHQVSAPLKDKSGYYVFRVEEKRVQPLEEVEPVIQTSLSIQKMNRRLEAVRDGYTVTLNPNYFSDAPAASPSAPRK